VAGEKPVHQTDVSSAVQIQQPGVQTAHPRAGKRKGVRVRDLSVLTRDREFQKVVSKASAELATDAVAGVRASLAEVERVYDQLDAKIDHNIAVAKRENELLDGQLMDVRRLKARFGLR
jgi:hypothetical protein